MSPETYNLNKKLITNAMASIEAWESWTEALPEGSKKALNLSLIRLLKGQVKAWRVYLSENFSQ
jgi:hypothetical protein